jgi:hypothetical protein
MIWETTCAQTHIASSDKLDLWYDPRRIAVAYRPSQLESLRTPSRDKFAKRVALAAHMLLVKTSKATPLLICSDARVRM